MEKPLFSQDIDNIEFSPRIPQPTSYVKTKSKNKRDREFDRLFLAQELRWQGASTKSSQSRLGKGEKQDQDAIWAIAFSRDGQYLAAGGENNVVKVWSVLATEDERQAQDAEEEENARTNTSVQMRASVFRSAPLRTYTDHEGAILDLSWSKVSFLLSHPPLRLDTDLARIIFF
jgi:WD40 repeat protein